MEKIKFYKAVIRLYNIRKKKINKNCKNLKSERRVSMRNIKLTIEYDGKDFNGWQKQPNKLNIQGERRRAGKGRTDKKTAGIDHTLFFFRRTARTANIIMRN